MKKKIIFVPRYMSYNPGRLDNDLTGSNFIGIECIGESRENLTKEECKVIDDVLQGVVRRKNLKNSKII